MENSEAELERIMEEALEDLFEKKYVHDGSLLTTGEYTAYLVFSIFMLNLSE